MSAHIRFTGVPLLTNRERAARLAVLLPATGSASPRTPKQVLGAARQLQRDYLRFISALETYDDSVFDYLCDRMRACKPTMVKTTHRGKPCKAVFCPWCQARAARQAVADLAKHLECNFGKEHDPKVDIWVLPLTKIDDHSTAAPMRRYLPPTFQQQVRAGKETLQKLAKQCGAFGGITNVIANVVSINGTIRYRFQTRGIVVVPAGTVMPKGLKKHKWVRSFECAETGNFPTQHDLATAVGICYRYPAGVLKHPVEVVHPLLFARKNMRLREACGVMYGWTSPRRVRREQKPALQLFENG